MDQSGRVVESKRSQDAKNAALSISNKTKVVKEKAVLKLPNNIYYLLCHQESHGLKFKNAF